MKKLHIAALVLALAFGLCACGGEGVQFPSEAPVETATPTVPATPTASPEATATPTPSPTPSPTVEPSPEATPEPTAAPTPTPTPKPTPEVKPEQPKETKKPNVPQQNLAENAEKNVQIPKNVDDQDSPIPGLPVITGGPMAGSSGTGVTDAGEIKFTEEEFWDPALQVDTYLGN